MTNALPQKLLRVEEAAEYLNVRPSTIRAWLLRRRLPRVQIGTRAVRIPLPALERMVEANTIPAREASQVSTDIARYMREMIANPTLAEAVMARSDLFPPPPTAPGRVTVRVLRRDADRGIARALALTVAGIAVRVEVVEI